MGDGGLRVGKQLDLAGVQADAMRPGHVGTDPIGTGEMVGNASVKLVTYPVQIEGGDIKVAV